MTLQCSHKRVLPNSFALSIGLGMGLWMITASGFNSSPDKYNSDETPTGKPVTPMAIYGSTNQAQLIQQRDLFKKAEQALSKRQYQAFDNYSHQLKDYPLYPYLVYRKMLRQIGKLSRTEIDQFFNRYSDNQLASRFKSSLLKYYARHQRWDDYLYYYTDQGSTTLQCHRLTALIKTGKTDTAFKLVEPLWLSAKSQPSACNFAFTAWTDAGLQTHQLTWKRIQLAMDKSRVHLAKHLAKSLNNIDQQWVSLWIQAHRQPQAVVNNPKFKISHPMSKNILLHAIRRQAIKDEDKAVELWQTLAQQHRFTAAEKYKVYSQLGLTMARRHHPEAEQWLVKIPSQYVTSEVTEWLIRTSIRHGNWDKTIQTIESMQPKQQSNLRWQFWWAYANEQLGNTLDAEGIYHYLATRRSYYGFIAADRLQLPYAFENKPLDIKQLDLVELSYYAEAIRAREFYEVDKYTDSRREWHQLALKLDNREKLIASKLAQHWNWHDRAIITMGKTKYRDDIELRFPLPLKHKITKYSKHSNVEPALTYAVIRRESSFMKDARSSQGALGLMQLMPGTARSVARSMNLRYRGKKSLLQEDLNLRLGTSYLGKMLERHDSQPVLATAAYNAGPHRVQKWLPETQQMDAIRWIETIPFTETREYVSNVLAYTTIYQHLMENEYTRISHRMPPVQPKNIPQQPAQLSSLIPPETPEI